MEKNGDVKDNPEMGGDDVKIIVVGEPKCGKTSFIELFYDKNGSGDCYMEESAKVYPCRYEVQKEMHDFKIFEIIGGPDEIVEELTGVHTDANGFVLMFAIDDPSSFLKVMDKWYPTLNKGDMWQGNEPAIVVGTKRDLRENQLVIQRLAQDNQAPVTQEQGESLVADKIKKYFDCSSIEPHNVDEAFDWILSLGFADLNAEKYGYAFSDSNADDS
ncbi:hypothetical protein AVEN_61552-1 [Araneus ventricosus]|uniref:Uncharacterized protein n=2 Tax=Araneus ventricosus TaxID=182803 RepID=A0A4Y2FRU0_ARAVE|nr:hypothetical protein AVEN_61552-1 [Araneus ventricosus]